MVVVRPEFLVLGVEHLDMHPENCEGERVEREQVLCVVGLAVRDDHLAVDDDSRRPDVKVTALRAAAPAAYAPGVRPCGADPRRHGGPGGKYLVRAYTSNVGIMACMAEPFRLHAADGCEWIIDPPVDPYGDGYVRKAGVEVRADGMTARTTATLTAVFDPIDGLVSFFAGLASGWRGWEGKRHWEALEQQMAIEAWHDGRANVMIAVTVRRPQKTYADDAWSARVVFTVEAGEQLIAVSENIASLLAA
jgi:hypothetical protein